MLLCVPWTETVALAQQTAAKPAPSHGAVAVNRAIPSPSGPGAVPGSAPAAQPGDDSPPPPSPSPVPAGKPPVAPMAREDEYPVIAQLEKVTFGQAKPDLAINERLSQLEFAVFHKLSPELSLQQRSQILKDTLLGPSPASDLPAVPVLDRGPAINPGSALPSSQVANPKPAFDPELARLEQLWGQPFYQAVVPREELERFALELVNEAREQMGLAALVCDDLASGVAHDQVEDLCTRNAISHFNKAGENPDYRYTKGGGSDALSESLVVLTWDSTRKMNREMIARMFHTLRSRQDDRDSLLSPDATHFGFSFNWTPDRDRVFACANVVCKHGIMHPLPTEVKVGEKIQVKGVILQPYKFQRVTIAWEGLNPAVTGVEEPTDEAMPYFPPLDYVAYQEKSERDHQAAITLLKTAGIIAAIAGGMFMPPVALAAPLIAMAPTGGSGEPKAAQDVPVHGGMKVEGSTFQGSVPVNNEGKPGLYYVTVWATTTASGRPVPVSRRIIIAREASKEEESKDGQAQPAPKKEQNERPAGHPGQESAPGS